MRSISGTLMATRLPWLPVLSNIAPPDLRRKEALLREFRKITSTPNLPIYQDLPQQESRLRSHKPPLHTASQLMQNDFLSNTSWTSSWESFDGRNKFLIPDPTKSICGLNLPRREWVSLNRFRTGVGRCNSWKFKWGMSLDQSCECEVVSQTMDHIVNECPLHSYPGGIICLNKVDEPAIKWLTGIDLTL